MKKAFFFSLAAALAMCFSACQPEDNRDDNGNGGNGYNQLIVGTWLVDNMTLDGENMTPQNLQFIFNANGQGMMNDNGVTENNEFGWSIDGNTITITPREGSYDFTINSLTSTECSFSGNTVPGTDIQGSCTVHMTKVSGGGGGDNPDPNPPDPANFPVGTIWSYDYSDTATEDGMTYTINISIRLHFGENGSGVVTQAEEAYVNGQLFYSDSEDLPMTYTYDASTHSGTMTVTTVNPDTDETETSIATFTYNESDNTMTFVDPEPDPDDPTGGVMVFHRVN